MSNETDDDQDELEAIEGLQARMASFEGLSRVLGGYSPSHIYSLMEARTAAWAARQDHLSSIVAAIDRTSLFSQSWGVHLQHMEEQSNRMMEVTIGQSVMLSISLASVVSGSYLQHLQRLEEQSASIMQTAITQSAAVSASMAPLLSWSARMDKTRAAALGQSLAIAEAAQAALAMGPAVRASLAQFDIPRSDLLHEVLLQPPRMFEQTANRYRIEEEEAEGDEIATVRASAGIVASSSATSIVCASNLEALTLYDPETGISGPFVGALPTYNILQVQRTEIHDRIAERGIQIDAEELLADLPYETELALGLQVRALILDCDRASRFAGEKPIFGASSKFMSIIAAFPGIIAATEKLLGEVVDYLYFLLWEDGGKKEGLLWSLLDAQHQDFVNDEVRLLRDNFYRHDVEHDSGAEEKMVRLTQFFSQCIGKAMPHGPGDYRKLQRYLLTRLVGLLAHVYTQLTRT